MTRQGVTRRFLIPVRSGWPRSVVLRQHAGAVVEFADGRQLTFLLESEMLEAYGWTWEQLRAWGAAEEGDTLAWSYRHQAEDVPDLERPVIIEPIAWLRAKLRPDIVAARSPHEGAPGLPRSP
jgi:hypothetical protein